MEPISITLEVANPANPVEWVEVEFLLDLGNRIAIVPAAILEKLGIYPFEKRSYDFEACEHRGVGIALPPERRQLVRSGPSEIPLCSCADHLRTGRRRQLAGN